METFIASLGFSTFLGILFVITGIVLLLFPPKKINYFYGYRTPGSMRTDARWHFAQRFSAIRLLVAGLALVAVSFVLPALQIPAETSFSIEIGMVVLSILYLFVATELALKKFPK